MQWAAAPDLGVNLVPQGDGHSGACGNRRRRVGAHARGQAPPPTRCGVPAKVSVCGWGRGPAEKGGVRETPTGLECALSHHGGEGAQTLRRPRCQAEGVLRVGLEVIHHEGCGRVEGPPHLGAVAGGDKETETRRL